MKDMVILTLKRKRVMIWVLSVYEISETAR